MRRRPVPGFKKYCSVKYFQIRLGAAGLRPRNLARRPLVMLFSSARNFASQVMWDPEGGNQHDPENLQFLAQIRQHLLPQIETMQPAPSDFLFDASDSPLELSKQRRR